MRGGYGFNESTMVPVNGVELEVFEAGQENTGNPIVLCHGWPEHAFSWRHQIPALMVYGDRDVIPRFEGLRQFVPNVEEVSLSCGHWIQQELPEKTNRVLLNWLGKLSDR